VNVCRLLCLQEGKGKIENMWDQPICLEELEPSSSSTMDQDSGVDAKKSQHMLLPPADFRMTVIPRATGGLNPAGGDAGVANAGLAAGGLAGGGGLSESARNAAATNCLQAVPVEHPLATHLPDVYSQALHNRRSAVQKLRSDIRKGGLSPTAQSTLESAVQAQFREWLLSSGNVKQVLDLVQ
jgi:hypothetical protein